MMEEVKEVDLCLICCSKVKNESGCQVKNNNQLLSSNLIVFYLLKNVLQVSDNELNRNLVSCGNPAQWIRLCDKCSELTRQAKELHRTLKETERELNCLEKLIWEKTSLSISIDSECDKESVKETRGLAKITSEVSWRRFRNHVTNKCKLRKISDASDKFTNPFIEGDKLANSLITQPASTAILPQNIHSEQDDNEDDNLIHWSSSSLVKIEKEYDGNWEPRDDTDDASEVDDDVGSDLEKNETSGATKLKTKSKVRQKCHRSSEKRSSKYIPKGVYKKIIITEEGKFQCRQCDQVFTSSSGCHAHERNKHSRTPGAFICSICGRAFNSPNYLRNHSKHSHKLKPDGTPIPQKAPKLEKDHICDQCGKGFTSTSLLNNHVRFVHDKRFHLKCSSCGAHKRSSDKLKKHMLVMHPEDHSTKKLIEEEGLSLWRCPVIGCSITFLNEQNVKGHLKIKHGKDEEQVARLELKAEVGAESDSVGAVAVILEDPGMKSTCTICGKTFGNRERLVRHAKFHENKAKGREFFCESCGKGYFSSTMLTHHVKTVHLKMWQHKKKDLRCEVCGKGFSYGYSLKEHLELHERDGKKEFCCDNCGRAFATQKYLKLHKKRTKCGVEKGD